MGRAQRHSTGVQALARSHLQELPRVTPEHSQAGKFGVSRKAT